MRESVFTHVRNPQQAPQKPLKICSGIIPGFLRNTFNFNILNSSFKCLFHIL